jgi:hypothetical protein
MLLSLPGVACAGVGAWTETGNLVTPRWGHTATTLSDGRVLVTGGWGSNNAPSDCEIYDPSTGAWTSTGNLLTPRVLHTATLLAGGKVLVAGGDGSTSGMLSSCEIYDPSTGAWTSTGNLNTPRSQHTATLIAGGKVLVAGGANGCEVYDPTSGKWATTEDLATGRWNHTATLLLNGNVLVTGGLTFGSSPVTLSSSEIYDPSNGTWTGTGSLITARWGHTATLFSDGKVLVAGGAGGWNPNTPLLADSEIYDPSNGTWTVTGDLATPRDQHTASLLQNGEVLVAGGQDVNNDGLSGCELYDESSGAWTAAGSLINGRYGHTASLLPDNNVLAAGGQNNTGVLSICEIYDPSATATAPGQPTNVTATAGDGWATVTFAPPSSTGGSPITGYTVTPSPNPTNVTGKGTGSPITVQGLADGTAYSFTVTAANAIGTGPPSSPSNSVTPQTASTVPGVPTNITATAGNKQVTVSFTPPASPSGSPITGYTVTSNPGNIMGKGTGSPITVSGLTNGQTYTFTVTAANKNGSGPASNPSNFATPATVPGAPTGVTAAAGNAQATVGFTAPTDNGSPISGYTVTSHPGNISATGTGTSITVSGLTNGTSYTFTVTATNGMGTGPSSKSSNSVKPSGPVPQGSLTVTIVGPTGSGAQWKVDNGTWRASGTSVNLSVGSHKVTFSTVSGWTTPAAQSVTITNGANLPIIGTYVQPLTFKLPSSLGTVQQCDQFSATVGPPTGGAGPPYTYSLGSGGFPPLDISVKTDLSPSETATVYGLTPSPHKNYKFQICVADVAGHSKCASTSITVTPPVQPGAPSNFFPANGAKNVSLATTLSWTEAANTDSCDVYFGTSSKPPLAANVTGAAYNPGTLRAKTTYYWQVVAKHDMCDSLNPTVAKGPVYSFTTENLSFDLPASLGSAQQCSPFNYQIATPAFGTAPYTFMVGSGSFPSDVSITSSGLVSGIIEETPATYTFNVCATDAAQIKVCQPTSIVVTAASSPGTPSGPTPANTATGVSTGTTLTWAAASNADQYDVYFGETLPTAPTATVSSPSYSPGALNPNTTYHWKIVAVHKMCGLLPDPFTDGPQWSFTTTSNPLTLTITSAACTQECYPAGTYDTITVTGTACGDVNSSIVAGLGNLSCPSWDSYCQRTSSTESACTNFTATSDPNNLAGQTKSGTITLWDGNGSNSVPADWSVTCPPNTCN